MIKDELTYKIIGCAMKVHNTVGDAPLTVSLCGYGRGRADIFKRVYNLTHPENKDYKANNPKIMQSNKS